MESASGRENIFQAWLLAARPKTLFAAASPVLIACAMALEDGAFRLLPAAAILLAALLIQIGTNFANDVFDFERGSDTEARLGPTRATQAGLVSPRQMKLATALVLGAALLLGVYLAVLGGWPIVLIGLASLVLAVAYTAGPYALAYTGLGDVFVLIFFGPVAVGGTYYIFTKTVTAAALWAGLCAGMIATGILVVNNLRDIEGDAASGKRTTAVRFGAAFARAEYALLLVLPAAICTALALHNPERRALLLVAAYLAAALPAVRTVLQGSSGRELNTVLEKTGRLLLLFCLLFSTGWLL